MKLELIQEAKLTMQVTMKKQSEDDLLSIRQAAELLGVNRMWLSGYLARDGIKLHRLGKSIGIRRRDLRKIEVPRKEA